MLFWLPAYRHFLYIKRIVLWLLLLHASFGLNAQQKSKPAYQLHRLSFQDGLLNQAVTSCVLDASGVLWIGTHDGLYTFDGFRLYPVEVQYAGKPDAPQFTINTLEIDSVGQNLIFLCTSWGIIPMDATNHRVVPETSIGFSEGFLRTCTQIKKSKNGSYWLLSGQNLYKLLKNKSNGYECQFVCALPHASYSLIQPDPGAADKLWVLSNHLGAVCVSDTGLDQFVFSEGSANPDKMPGISQLEFTAGGIYGWDSKRNVYRINNLTKRIENVNGEYDLYKLIPELKWVDNYLEIAPILNCHSVVLKEQIFLGTSQGLFMFRKNITRFHAVEALRGEEIRGIYADSSGRWWAGTYPGLVTGSLNQASVRRLGVMPGVWDYLPVTDRFWLIAVEQPRGIAAWDPHLGKEVDLVKLTEYLTEKKGALSGLSICRDNRGEIWLGTYNRLLKSSGYPPYHFQYWIDPRTGMPAQLTFVRALLPDPSGGIWAGFEDGLLHIVFREASQRYEIDTLPPNLKGTQVSDLYLDRRQRLWIATKGKGLACLDLKSSQEQVKWYNTERGLPHNFTCRIEGCQNDEVLWVSTHNGLSQFDTRTGKFSNYFDESGFSGNEFNSAASCKAPDGTMLFGGVFGLVWFHPDSIPIPEIRHQTFLSGAIYYHQESKKMDALFPSLETGLALPPYPEYLELRIGSTEFVSPERQRFRYRLRGLSELWTYVSDKGEVRFIRLGPGSYVFEAQAILFDGSMAAPVLLPIYVESPFFETWWFKTLLLALLIGMGFLAYRYRVRQLLREQLMRQQIADDLHDDIGNKLNIISITAQNIAKSQPENSPQVQELKNLMDTSRNALRSLHTMIWSVDAKKDRLSSLYDRIQDFAVGYLRPLHIKFKFDLQGPVSNRFINLKARHHIIMIYQELLTNMVKYTQPVLINISIRLEGDTLHMKIENQHQPYEENGITSISASRGVPSIKRRLNRLQGKLSWEEPSSERQEVTLVVPHVFRRG